MVGTDFCELKFVFDSERTCTQRQAGNNTALSVAGLENQQGFMHFDAWHCPVGSSCFEPRLHFVRIENLPLFHERQDERLRHSISPTLLALPFLPAISSFDFLCVAGAYQTAHKTSFIFVWVAA
jgi:hypothetical protein